MSMNPDDAEGEAWIRGFVTALADMHRRLIRGNDSSSVRRVANAAGVTIKSARSAGVSAYDLKELRKAGIR